MKTEWLKKEIQEFVPYEVPQTPAHIIINANERGDSFWEIPRVAEAVKSRLLNVKPNLYPRPFADTLRAKTAAYVERKPEEILLGNGGDEMISLLNQTFLDHGDSILIHGPTFDMYALGAQASGANVVVVKDRDDFTHDVTAFVKKIKKVQPKIVYVCNPNNPTGRLWTKEEVRTIVEAAPYVVVVDEAYMEFCSDQSVSMLSDIDTYSHMFVLRTFSKAFGLAGARVGYLVGQKEAIDAVSKLKPPYNLNVFTQAIAETILDFTSDILAGVSPIRAAREYFIKALEGQNHIEVFPSETNFVFLRSDRIQPLYESLLANDILVKYYKPGHVLFGCMRITITTQEVVNKIVDIIKEVCTDEA